MKILLFIALFCISFDSIYALTLQPPSLLVQMKRQDKVNANAKIIETKIKNQMRLAEIRAERLAEKGGNSSSSPTPPSLSVASSATSYPNTNIYNLPNVDLARVRSAWFGWYNDYRATLGLGRYAYDSRLDSTAHDWNIIFAEGKGQNHHRRNARDSYYDFPVIDTWFTARGVNPKVINRSKHTENVGYGYYTCTSGDCTNSLITSIRSTFDFFMSEKGKSYDAHYRSIVNPYFTKMGFDIIIVPSERRYYMTVHYITE